MGALDEAHFSELFDRPYLVLGSRASRFSSFVDTWGALPPQLEEFGVAKQSGRFMNIKRDSKTVERNLYRYRKTKTIQETH